MHLHTADGYSILGLVVLPYNFFQAPINFSGDSDSMIQKISEK